MNINIRNKTVFKMLELCKRHKKGKLYREELEDLLEHDDYKVEFERYNTKGLPITNITKEEFVDYFINLQQLDTKDIQNERLRIHHIQYKYFFNNLDFYEKEIKKLLLIDESIVKEGLKYTINGLPSYINFDSLDVIFTISIGNSFGWPYKNCIHFDVLSFFKLCNINDLKLFKSFIGHEVHHIGYNKFSQEVNISKFNPEEYLYYFLAFEGLAVKYCNNGQGILTKKIYNDLEQNVGMDTFTWNYLRDEFYDIFNEFKSQIQLIRIGKIKDLDDIKEIISEYWLNSCTKLQEKEEVPKLKHSKNYYFGNEIWGLIHDIYGKEKVFEVLKKPKEFPKEFNKALNQIGRTDLII
ncbi:DUF5700 domain-containing putative Zn-dependent protease [Senegalia massiliensis]|uniref:DUF2268 domain-containing protein n=1 Tax=Senegalia massiliensis TaxID=1720316 RepID=A0A845QUC2_9CLOT|nr:DUF5700 domain-containing putative Zn-dependent protease [Senegalia massiliensis]NBI05399.1 hypothetical protein [Senegalia massiliensis]